MDLSAKKLKNTAGLALANAACDVGRLVLVYSAVALGAGFLAAALGVVMNAMIQSTGGLADLGLRTVLSTISASVDALVSLLTPFWSLGFTYCAIALARQAQVGQRDLTMGLRRWAPVLRLTLLQAALYLLLGYLVFQVASAIFMLLPASDQVLQVLESMVGDPTYLNIDSVTDEMAAALLPVMLPVYAIAGVLMLVLFVPVSYSLRFCFHRVLDGQRHARLAMGESRRMLRGYKRKLFLLDLSFWWFYLLQALSTLLLRAEDLLTLAGVQVPMDSAVFGLLCYLAYCLVTLALQVKFLARVETTYAAFYDALLPPSPQSQDLPEEI